MPFEIVAVMGKSGAGKHRYVAAVGALRGLEAVATGAFFRSAAAGAAARTAAEHGRWAPDEAADRFVEGQLRRCRQQGRAGCVLDGYPRTKHQAEQLLRFADRLCSPRSPVPPPPQTQSPQKVQQQKQKQRQVAAGPTAGHNRALGVVLVETPDSVLVERMLGRRVCTNSACGAVYNVTASPPTPDGRCRRCGARVVRRADDSDERRIRARLAQFDEKTAPALELLRARGVPVARVPGTLPLGNDELLHATLRSAMNCWW